MHKTMNSTAALPSDLQGLSMRELAKEMGRLRPPTTFKTHAEPRKCSSSDYTRRMHASQEEEGMVEMQAFTYARTKTHDVEHCVGCALGATTSLHSFNTPTLPSNMHTK